jgi:C-terminal region of peptidase_M24
MLILIFITIFKHILIFFCYNRRTPLSLFRPFLSPSIASIFLFFFLLIGFLGFEKLTHIPIQKKLIDVSLLTEKEINWLNTYHAEVREKVYPLMITDLGRKWLIESTNPLEQK